MVAADSGGITGGGRCAITGTDSHRGLLDPGHPSLAIKMRRPGQLLLTVEFKSQVGPSLGNNFNNRTEEATGNAEDIWTA